MLCTSHAGPHHLAGLTLSLRGLPVVEATVNPTLVDMLLPAPGGPGSALRRYEERARERLPVRTIPTGPGAGPKALRKAVRTLGRGSVLVMPGDGLWGESTIEVPLAAGRARLPTGPPRLAWMTGASLVCGCVLPRGEGRWSLHLGPARQPPAARGGTKSKPAGEWIGASVAWYAQWLEDQIAAWPELFLWRWATIHRLQYLGVEEFFEAGE